MQIKLDSFLRRSYFIEKYSCRNQLVYIPEYDLVKKKCHGHYC